MPVAWRNVTNGGEMSRSTRASAPAWVLLVPMLLAISVLPVRAQDADPQTAAERAFREGVALRAAGDLDGAIARLRRAHRLAPHGRPAYNLAAALVEAGDLVEARSLLRRILGRSGADRDLLIADAARALLEAISPRIAVVRVQVLGAEPQHALIIDGERSIGGPARDVSLDPGAHRFEVLSADGTVLARSEVELAEGDRRSVSLRPVSAPSMAMLERRDVVRAAREPVTTEERDRWIWIVIASGIAVAVAAGTVVTVASLAGS